MSLQKTSDLRIAGRQEVISANSLISELPISETSSETVFNARKEFSDILYKKDKRLAVVVGPALYMIQMLQKSMQNFSYRRKKISKSTY